MTIEGHGRKKRAWLKWAMFLALIATMASLTTGCRASGMIFTKSSGFRIVSPSSFSSVSLPLTVSWTEGAPFQSGDKFAVFIDRGSIGIGDNVRSLIPKSCREVSTCSQDQYLQQQDVYVTTSASLNLPTLPSTSLTGHSSGKEDHEIVVVVLDGSGHRVGEQYASVDFVYNRPALVYG